MAVRIGATDLSAVFGLRRRREVTVYDVRVVADVIADVVNVLGRADGTARSSPAPVWEYFSGNPDRVFKPSCARPRSGCTTNGPCARTCWPTTSTACSARSVLDQANGLAGKTVHPTPPTSPRCTRCRSSHHEDHADALDVLGAGAGGGAAASTYRNKMNESKPHRAWAQRLLQRAHVFGVARPHHVVRRPARRGHAPVSRAPWAGDWVAGRLDVDVRTTSAAGDLQVRDLVGLAVRVNPRRVHLLVSAVLGKHVPVDPDLVRGAGLLLGRLVADRLAGVDSGVASAGGDLLARALREDDPRAASSRCRRPGGAGRGPGPRAGRRPGARVRRDGQPARAPGGRRARRRRAALHPAGRSAPRRPAPSRRRTRTPPVTCCCPRTPGCSPSIGRSCSSTTSCPPRHGHGHHPRPAGPRAEASLVVAGLVDLRTDDARAELRRFAAELGIEVDVVALASGVVELPADVLARGAALLADHPARRRRPPGPSAGALVEVACGRAGRVPGRRAHGFTAAHRTALDEALPGLADQVQGALGPDPAGCWCWAPRS